MNNVASFKLKLKLKFNLNVDIQPIYLQKPSILASWSTMINVS